MTTFFPSMNHRHDAVFLFLTLSFVLILSGCDVFGGDEDNDTFTVSEVIVGNSGLFADQRGGSLTIYDPATQTVSTADLGVAFVNSLTLRDGRLYVIDNTSSDNAGRITIFDAATLDPLGQIQNSVPPRDIAFVSDAKAYVTGLGPFDDNFNPTPGAVSVVDLTQEAVSSTVEVGLVPEGIAVAAGKAFVANAGSGGQSTTLTVIDTATDAVTGTLDVGCDGPSEVFVDGEGEVVVVCSGQAAFTGNATDGEVLFLNPETETVTTRIPLDAGISSANGTQAATYAAEAEAVFAISSGTGTLFRIDTDANALADRLTVPEADDLVGLTAVAYDASREQVYAARLPVGDEPGVPDFTSAGAVVVLDAEGVQIDRFTVGVAPAHILFR
jgi:YVTN family beta-propeller protein